MLHGNAMLLKKLFVGVFCMSLFYAFPAFTQPTGFIDQVESDNWDQLVGFTWDDNGQQYVWEKGGKVWVVDINGNKLATPLLDISEEVGNWRDFGMLGFALDPNFLTNGFFYVNYLVDRHHLFNFGTGSYSATTNEYFDASIGRVTRFQADINTNFTTLVPNSRFVLIGETKETGMPHLHESHGIGQIVFGTDGTLLVAMGDGASYNSVDEGSASETYWQQALADGIITTAENIGAYRCQILSSLNGKILRIDPMTGDGLPSNPYYQSGNPRSPQSRIWSLGVRNPYRITKKPDTGNHDPTVGDPGVFFFGDVGWGTWEDLNVISGPGQNFGWPKYEGIDYQPGYNNPTYEPTSHRRPKIDFRHGQDVARGWVNGMKVDVGSAILPGNPFRGNASTGGFWYTGDDFPPAYKNTYFHADYSAGWIRNFEFDANNNPTQVNEFATGLGPVVFLNTHPIDGGLYYVSYPDKIKKISYTGNFNSAPIANATAEILNQSTPVNVQFTGDQSFDPDFDVLTYLWDFDDGTTSTTANPMHTFNPSNSNPIGYDVTLTVSDGSLTDVLHLPISANNTAPVIIATSIDNVADYSATVPTNLSLSASVADAEHSTNELTFAWDISLHHNDHFHAEPTVNSASTIATLSPIGCSGATYWYRIKLTVTDPVGASTSYTKDLYPDCTGNTQSITFQPITDKFITDANFSLSATSTAGLPIYYYVTSGPATVTGNTVTLTGLPGEVTIIAAQHGDNSTATAIPVARSFQVLVPSGGNCSGSGTISREVWTGISGVGIAQIPLNTPPDIADERTIFEIPVNALDNFGTRMRGFICPPITGQYTFWISSDDNGELYLSNNADPANKTLIANVPSWSSSRQWDKFSEQQSAPVTLIAGESYYIEALQKEGTGGDNLAVGWQLPNGTFQRPIPGSRLSPYNGIPPVASFTASPLMGNAPLFVTFDASNSMDADGTITDYAWDFGDGNTGSGVSATHTFMLPNDYTVTLTVTDNDGNTATSSTIITATENTNPPFITFSDESNLLSNTNFNSGVVMGIADMNSDGRDDIIRFDNARELNIEYQQSPNGAFSNFNFGNVSTQNQWTLAVGDADENGYNDLITGGAYDDIKLLTANNNGTNFTQSTLPNSNIFVQGSNFIDINNDGDLDIFACHDDAESQKWQGDGTGNFTLNNNLIPTATNPASDDSGNYASIWVDYDNDGDQDLYISKCRQGANSPTDPRRINMLFQNDGNNNFTEVADQAGLKIGAQSWVTDFADIDNDGDMDAFVVNHFDDSQLMENNGNGTFTDITAASGMLPDLDLFGIQSVFKDFDNDGFVDLVISGTEHRLFQNNGDKTFTNIPNPFNANQIESLAIGDLNHDGFPDIYAGYANLFNTPTNIDDRIFMNAGNSNNWLAVNLLGTESNVNGIGARIELHGAWGMQIREVRSGEGYGTMNSFTRFFGIGTANSITKVVVKWPSGIINEILNPSINQFLNITETPPVGGEDVDLELSLSTSNNEPAIYSTYTVTATISNTSVETATGIVVDFPLPDGVVFVGGSEANASQGTYDPNSTREWNIGTLAAGATATLEVSYFLLTADPVTSWCEVIAQNETDLDSTPNNGTCCTANEDDEADLTVPQAGPENQTITFPTIPNKETTDAPFDLNATASSSLSVSYSIVSGPATIFGNTVTLTGQTGTVTIEATQAGDANWNPAPAVTRSFNVNAPGLMNQTIAFSPIPNKQTDSPDFPVFGTASSGLPVSYSIVSGPATISGNTVSLTGQTGQVVVRASQGGNAQFNPAPDVDQNFTVSFPAGQGDMDLDLVLTSSNGMPSQWSNFTVTATLSNSGPGAATNVKVSFPKPDGVVFQGGNEFDVSQGSYASTGNQIWDVGTIAENETATLALNFFLLTADPVVSYVQVTDAMETDADSTPDNGSCCVANEDDEAALTVPLPAGPQPQTINFPNIANKETTDAPFTIAAAATSGLPVSFVIESGPATISGNTITLDGVVGTVVVRASQDGDANWNPAPEVTRSFNVTPPGLMNQTIDFTAIPNKQITDAPFTITATATSNLPVDFVIESGPATISGNTITLDGTVGTVVVRASQDGDSMWNPAPDVTRSFTVSGPIGMNEIDIELSMVAANPSLQIWNNNTFTLTVVNNGAVAANNVLIDFPIPDGMAFTSVTTSAGAYDLFFQNWDVGSLAVGQSETIDLELFILQNTNPVDVFAQVTDAAPLDTDSTPDNNNSTTPVEDDEVVVNLNPPGVPLVANGEAAISYVKFQTTKEESSQKAVRLFPNPATDLLKMDLSAFVGRSLALQIFDNQGRSFYQEKLEGATETLHTIDVSKWQAGTFVVWIQVVGEAPIVRKVVVIE